MSVSRVAAAPRVEILPLEGRLVGRYLDFARQAFGEQEYQARRAYLTWLYEEGPIPRFGLGDAKLALVGDSVVGCMHKLRMPWSTPAGSVEVASPHNLMVSPTHRTGAGFALISESLKGEKHTLLLGVAETVRPVYERLGCRPIQIHSMRTVLNPLTALAVFGARRVAPRAVDRMLDSVHGCVDGVGIPRLSVHTLPDLSLLADLAAALASDGSGRSHVAWTADLLRWRCFDRRGPRHVVVRVRRPHGSDPGPFAILSLGIRRNLLVCRTIEWHAPEDRDARILAHAVRLVGTALGANVLLSSAGDAHAAAAWRATGSFPVSNAPTAFELHRPKTVTLAPWHLFGGASDAGFEAIPAAVADRS